MSDDWQPMKVHASKASDLNDVRVCHYWWTNGEDIHLCDLQANHHTAHICACGSFT